MTETELRKTEAAPHRRQAMSEPMLTREQIEAWNREADYTHEELLVVKFTPAELKALATLALSSIAMREALKPFAETGADWSNPRLMDEDFADASFTIGDLRRASEAYQEQGK